MESGQSPPGGSHSDIPPYYHYFGVTKLAVDVSLGLGLALGTRLAVFLREISGGHERDVREAEKRLAGNVLNPRLCIGWN